jgi:hypothetical protein
MKDMQRESLKRICFGAAIATSLAGCAGDPDVDVTTEEIIGGFPARSARLDAIGALGYDMGDGTFFPFCSGTLIRNDVVLTAEHCVNWISDPTPVRFLIGWNASTPKQVIPVAGFAWEQTVEGGLVGLGSDVAVMHLADPVVGVTPLAYAAINPADYGRRFAGVGYGQQDSLGTSGTRLAGSLTFQSIGGLLFEIIYGSFEDFIEQGAGIFFPPDLDLTDPAILQALQDYYDQSQVLDVEGFFGNGVADAQVCFGDSGGPITAQLGGQTTTFGVASWVPFADSLCRYGSVYATLNPISLDFIDYELNCPMIPREGTCDGLNVAVRCAPPEEGGYHPVTTDCSELGLICGVDELGEIGCTEDPCEGLPPEGVCDGTTAVRCSLPEEGPRRVVSTDCAILGMTCGLEDGAVACVDDGLPDCGHGTCEEGPPLDAECGTCEASICAVDPYCCETFWDSICVDEAETICGETCPDPVAETASFDWLERLQNGQ